MIREEVEEEDRRRRGRKEWKKSHTKAMERLCLAEGCDFKTERGEDWNAKVGEQWGAVLRPEEPTSTSPPPPWLVHSWSVCWAGASQHYSRPVEFPGGGKSSSGSGPHIKMTKQRKKTPKSTESNERSEMHEGKMRMNHRAAVRGPDEWLEGL